MATVPPQVGPYKIEKQLGAGSTANVYTAVEQGSGTRVILKIVPADLDAPILKRFVAETKIIARLDHPNIVRIRDVGREGKLYYYVREYVEARTLEDFLRHEADTSSPYLPTQQIISICTDMGRALKHSHEQKVWHRDVKPGNILLDGDFRAILMDFGLAKMEDLESITKTGAILGTPLYMSPEQLAGKRVDHRSDFYSLGLVLYRMATGALPFESDNPYSSALRRMQEDVEGPSNHNRYLPPSLERIILRLLEREPEHRYQSADELLEDLTRVLDPRDGAYETVDISASRDPRDSSRTARPRSTEGLVSRRATVWLALFALALGLAIPFIPRLAEWTMAPPDDSDQVVTIGQPRVKAGAQTARISFDLSRAYAAEVQYGRADGPMDRVRVFAHSARKDHVGTLTELAPASRYRYRIRLLDEKRRLITSGLRSFVTASDPMAPGPERKLARAIRAGDADGIRRELDRLSSAPLALQRSVADLGRLLHERDPGIRIKARELMAKALATMKTARDGR